MGYHDRARKAANNGSAHEKKAWGNKFPHRVVTKGNKAFPVGTSFTFYILDLTQSDPEARTGVVPVECLNAKKTITPRGKAPITITDTIPFPVIPAEESEEFLQNALFEWEGEQIYRDSLLGAKQTKEEYGEDFYPFKSSNVRILVAITSVQFSSKVNVKAEDCPLMQIRDKIEATKMPQLAYIQLSWGQYANLSAEAIADVFDGDPALQKANKALKALSEEELLQAFGLAYIDVSEEGSKKKKYMAIAPPFEFNMKATSKPGNGFGDKAVTLEPCWDEINAQVEAGNPFAPADRVFTDLVSSSLLKALENDDLYEQVLTAMWTDELTLEEFKQSMKGIGEAVSRPAARRNTTARSFEAAEDEDEAPARTRQTAKAVVDAPNMDDDLEDEDEDEEEAPKPKRSKKVEPVVEEDEDEDDSEDVEDEDEDEEATPRRTNAWASRRRN